MAGPMFGDCLDEVVMRATQAQCSKIQGNKKIFPKDSVYYLHVK
jgi:hypothetical protein